MKTIKKQQIIDFLFEEIEMYIEGAKQYIYSDSNDSQLEYGENQFLLGKKEALEDVLSFLNKD